MDSPDFWLVWNPNGHMPSYRHSSEHQAREEAMRLARNAPGERFFVLAAMDSVVCPKPPVEWSSSQQLLAEASMAMNVEPRREVELPF